MMLKRVSLFVLISAIGLAAAGFFYFFTADKGVSDAEYRKAFRRNYKIFTPPVPEQVTFAGVPVPMEIFYVSEALDRELLVNTYWHNQTMLMFKRAHRWFPLIEPILARHGIPEDFKYLAVIESGLSNAVSPSGATGFWQFLKGTAKDYGLEVDKTVDERYHVEKSTEAACEYLKDSYEKFNDWALVAAAYNGGNRRISEELEEQKADSYYELLLSEETSRYVYRIIALKTIFENPTYYGFFLREKDFYPVIPVRSVIVENDIKSLPDFAAANGISYKTLKYFNPWLRDRKLKVKRGRTYKITLPQAGYRDYHSLKEEMHDDGMVYGDTLKFNEL